MHIPASMPAQSALLLLLFLFIITSCSHREEVVSDWPAEYSEKFPTYKLVKTGNAVNVADIENQILLKLGENNPVEILPASNSVTAQERNAVVASYVSFSKKVSRDSAMLRYFRDRYASQILVRYQFLKSDNYKHIAFLTNELLQSETGRFALILDALEKLRGNIGGEEFVRLLNLTQSQISKTIALHEEAQDHLLTVVANLEEKMPNGEISQKAKFWKAELQTSNFTRRIELLGKYNSRLDVL